jgi:hypothetical protein
VVDVEADHYSILISPPAISAVERFVGARTLPEAAAEMRESDFSVFASEVVVGA